MNELKEMWQFFCDHPDRAWRATKRGWSKGWCGESWDETKGKFNLVVILLTVQTVLLATLVLFGGPK